MLAVRHLYEFLKMQQTHKGHVLLLIKRLNEWKNNVENRCMRVNINKTEVMISGERQKPLQKAARWPCGVCGRGVLVVIQ